MKMGYDEARLLLNKMEREIEEQLEHMTHDALGESLGESIQELSMYDNHPADVGSEVFERGKDLALRDHLSRELEDIRNARMRMTEGAYGKCLACGKIINKERLEAKPTAAFCIECQTTEEKRYPDRHPRPIEEDVPPFPLGGRSDNLFSIGHDGLDKDSRDPVEFDGEDTWQILAQYGSSDTPSDIEYTPEYPNIYQDHGERVGGSEAIEMIPVEKGEDGVFYQDMDGFDDELPPNRL